MNTLAVQGVVVVEVGPAAELAALAAEARAGFVEYKPEALADPLAPLVLGGFGAYGNPSSFHHPAIRELRARAARAAAPVLRDFIGEGWHMETLFDRFCVRARALGKPTAEAWHRDCYDADKYGKLRPLQPDDVVLGGWLNCNAEPADDKDSTRRVQFFSCAPGTHVGAPRGGGFAPVPPAEHKTRVRVPPGHMVIFLQGLVHEVVAGVQPDEPSTRLFTGFRLTRELAPLFADIDTVIDSFAVPRIPSGQRPPMFSRMHFMHSKLPLWGPRVFREGFLKPQNNMWLPSTRLDRAMDALLDYGVATLPPYSPDERALMRPVPF